MTTENACKGSGPSFAGEATDVVAAPPSDVRLGNRTGLLSMVAMVVAATVSCGAQQTPPLANDVPAVAPGAAASSATDAATGVGPSTASFDMDAAATPAAPGRLTSKSVPLPGAEGPAFLDYVVYERAKARVWVPVASTGSVDVFDTASGAFTRIDGFKKEDREANGKKRTMGPSAATVGEGFVYVGNRASSEVCPVDTNTLKSGGCIKLSSPTDGVEYVASAREVWVTTPRDRTLTILDASKPDRLKVKATIKTEGAPEGYAVDDAHGLFFTNLEDKGGTLTIDVKTRQVKSTWNAGCGADGPRGVGFDAVHDFVIVACTDHVQVLDATHDGAQLGKLETGAGLDNIDVVDATVYAASGKSARLTVARIDDKGQLALIASGDTTAGARNAVADPRGHVYVPDSLGAHLLVFSLP